MSISDKGGQYKRKRILETCAPDSFFFLFEVLGLVVARGWLSISFPATRPAFDKNLETEEELDPEADAGGVFGLANGRPDLV
jgi:hypothetical protein